MLKIGILSYAEKNEDLLLEHCSSLGRVHPIIFLNHKTLFEAYNESKLDYVLDKILSCNILVVNELHEESFDFVEACIKNGKHIFIAGHQNIQESIAKHWWNLSIESQSQIFISQQNLCNPLIDYSLNSMDDIKMIQIKQQGFSYTLDNVHAELTNMIDIIRIFSRSNVSRVFGHGISSPTESNKLDVINGRIEFDDGVLSTISLNAISDEFHKTVEIYSAGRQIVLDFVRNEIHSIEKSDGHEIIKRQLFQSNMSKSEVLLKELDVFINTIEKEDQLTFDIVNYFSNSSVSNIMLEKINFLISI